MTASRSFKNILIIKPGAIGDLLQLTPVVRALKEKYPSAKVSLLVGSAATAQLFRYNANVTETIVFDKNGTHRSLRALVGLWRSLKEKKFDLVVNFQRSNLKTWFLASAAFPCRILVYHKSRARNVHAVANYLGTLLPLDITGSRMELELTPGAADRAFARQLISDLKAGSSPLIALNPGASHKVNRWPPDYFAELADRLAKELSAQVIVIGGREDLQIAEYICGKTVRKPFQLAGKADLLQLAATLEICDLVISGDTGPMHLATAVGTPVLALFGAADPDRTGPVGKDHKVLQAENVECVPCRARTCSNRVYLKCMHSISVDMVFNAAVEMLRRPQL